MEQPKIETSDVLIMVCARELLNTMHSRINSMQCFCRMPDGKHASNCQEGKLLKRAMVIWQAYEDLCRDHEIPIVDVPEIVKEAKRTV